MDLEYDQKFDAMKKYIPFLENMIQRLENTSCPSNPRQAQLNKIRSLRDLLLDKKKRMKMENLVKCEQVLINLYSKVEQRDAFSSSAQEQKFDSVNTELDIVRNKLKSVVLKLNEEVSETLPEISRATKIEEVCEPGSKEPALFQRRPSKIPMTTSRPIVPEVKEIKSSDSSKRNYTRVLTSPEPNRRSWSNNEKSSEKPLFSRRSPRRSPRRFSPAYSKKERKKVSKEKLKYGRSKDLNITLKVPEESLLSLNTKDILSRIINCKDTDVDIATLRELRTQILGELKQTGSNDDISELILRSYQKKDKKTNHREIEEGELSDSESEAIENIYGSLVIMEKEKSVDVINSTLEKDKPRKIQICLVINSDKNKMPGSAAVIAKNTLVDADVSDFENFNDLKENDKKENISNDSVIENTDDLNTTSKQGKVFSEKDSMQKKQLQDEQLLRNEDVEVKQIQVTCAQSFLISQDHPDTIPKVNVEPPSLDQVGQLNNTFDIQNDSNDNQNITVDEIIVNKPVEIPLLNFEETVKKEVESEIDILQALKNEILNETASVLNTESLTPPLHQPKITKVSNAQEVGSKKRISIENYKAKSNISGTLYKNDDSKNFGEDCCKKSSLKLTEKECERFNFLSQITLADSSEEEDKSGLSVEDIYGDLAPRSPDYDDFLNTGIKSPVIIPNDPIDKSLHSEADIDMRRLLPNSQQNTNDNPSNKEVKTLRSDWDIKTNSNDKNVILSDPRIRRDFNKESPTSYSMSIENQKPVASHNMSPYVNSNNTPNFNLNMPSSMNSSMTPIMNSSITPNINPNMTPNVKFYQVTPSRPTLENEDYPLRRHVYAPLFPVIETKEIDNSLDNYNWTESRSWEDRNIRSNSVQKDFDYHENVYDRYNYAKNETYSFKDCPPTPNHTYGRTERGLTSNPSFGRNESPMTPIYPYSRSDCPPTPNHPFGRPDPISMPAHSLGRSDYNYRSSNIHSYPRKQDLKWHRNSDFDRYNSKSYKPHQNARSYNADAYRFYNRDKSVGMHEREVIDCSRRNIREKHYRRDPSVGRFSDREYENELYNSYNRSIGRKGDYKNQHDSKSYKCNNKYYSEQYVKSLDDRYSRSNVGCFYQKEISKENNFSLITERSEDTLNFVDRRQRAASVGRTFDKNSVVEKTSKSKFKPCALNETDHVKNFRRASSVGRELNDAQTSFKDVKEDLRQFKINCDRETYEKSCRHNYKKDELSRTSEDSNSKRESSDSIKTSRSYGNYFPDHYSRDPRVRNRSKYDYKNEQTQHSNVKERTSGIVYSSDNISKGTILGNGCGVKNYRIPKIKRLPVKTETITEQNKEKNTVTTTDIVGTECNLNIKGVKSNKSNRKDREVEHEASSPLSPLIPLEKYKATKSQDDDIIEQSKEKNNSKENHVDSEDECLNNLIKEEEKKSITSENVTFNTDIRVTRSSTKKNINDFKYFEELESPIKRTKRNKRPYVYDSDSDKSEELDDKIKIKNMQNTSKNQGCEVVGSLSNIKNDIENLKESGNNKNQQKIDSYSITDLETFTEINICDPIIDNINAIIADLDQDLDTTKEREQNYCTGEIREDAQDNQKCYGDETGSSKVVIPLDQHLLKKSKESESNFDDQTINLALGINSNKIDQFKDVRSQSKNHTCTDVSIHKTDNIQTSINSLNNEKKLIQFDGTYTDKTSILEVSEHDSNMGNCDNEIIGTNSKDIVSTSDTHLSNIVLESPNESSSITMPDSTVSFKHTHEHFPDSTGAPCLETSNEITSTNSIADECHVIKQTPSDIQTPVDSIGSLLLLLQDKSKINELLSRLSEESSQNEKMKKKLEKLSKIVSEDEDVPNISSNNKIDVEATECRIEKEKKSENHNHIEIHNKEEKNSDEESEKNRSNLLLTSNVVESSIDMDIKGNLKLDVQESLCTGSDKLCLNENVEPFENNLINVKKNLEMDVQESVVIGTNKSHLNENIESLEENLNNVKENSEIDDEDSVCIESDKSYLEEKLNNVIETSSKEDVKITSSAGKKNKTSKKGKTKNIKRNVSRSKTTRSNVSSVLSVKKPSRELKNLQADLKEMFIKDDILSTTGIRMCRLAKLNEDKPQKNEVVCNETAPVVVLEKWKKTIESENLGEKRNKVKKAKSPVADTFSNTISEQVTPILHKPGPKSKTKPKEKDGTDPYDFDADSMNDNNIYENKCENSSDSESESTTSTKETETLQLRSDFKKKLTKKRAVRGWKAGIIRSKSKKKKTNSKTSSLSSQTSSTSQINAQVPDVNSFIDKSYCFDKNVSCYFCRLCNFSGLDIVSHFKTNHPHFEVPLSRINPVTSKQAIKECQEENFHTIIKNSSNAYVCRFCFIEVRNYYKGGLEAFFWHIVSAHTGEYLQKCSECVDTSQCPYNIDIPLPPKTKTGQLLGYICGKCNFTQISLENLKLHVINRHMDERTEVFTINLAEMSTKLVTSQTSSREESRVLRSRRAKQTSSDVSTIDNDSTEDYSNGDQSSSDDNYSENEVESLQNIQKKLTFENDTLSDGSGLKEPGQNQDSTDSNVTIKTEKMNDIRDDIHRDEQSGKVEEHLKEKTSQICTDILDYPHFKMTLSDSGLKEYVCCINGNESHYKSTLLISFKKHVQNKHFEKWDGYCFICKVIVTSQGNYHFKDCLEHFLDKHMDNFPVLEKSITNETPNVHISSETPKESESSQKNYINVRPLSQLISTQSSQVKENTPILPVIESVVSLGSAFQQQTPESANTSDKNIDQVKIYKYEESQEYIMKVKQPVVREAMMTRIKLAHIFKCGGRFCSFSTDSAEDALLHASTHMRVGGENALCCTYCDFDCGGNGVDLITHVFTTHGSCQYFCSMCFYRAAASQLVHVHVERIHKDMNCHVLRYSIMTGSIDESDMLSREQAVAHYLCTDPCKFRTFTAGKFSEHLLTRHSTQKVFSCFICSEEISTPTEYMSHIQTHGLKLYQCTWCVFGADNESELLVHASIKHPTKQPKAYLRIITNKEGSTECRVLPMAQLNRSYVPTTDVHFSYVKENPVREAERSIELEKILGPTIQTIESMITSMDSHSSHAELPTSGTGGHTFQPLPDKTLPPAISPSLSTTKNVSSPILTSEISTPLITNSSSSSMENVLPETIKDSKPMPIIKTEKETTLDKQPDVQSNIVHCLDSDEEDNQAQNVIYLSDDETLIHDSPLQMDNKDDNVLLANEQLLRCSKCSKLLKTSTTFKKHLDSCYANVDEIPCAHCSNKFNRRLILNHYIEKHLQRNEDEQVICRFCNKNCYTKSMLKHHMKVMHSFSIVPTKQSKSVEAISTTAKPKDTPRPGPKSRRKQSLVNKEKVAESSVNLKKYGPLDVDKLPINPILDSFVYCLLCNFNTKVRLNMVRHLQLHAEQQPVPQTAPVNPVPHLVTNERHFDKMLNLASSSIVAKTHDKTSKNENVMISPEEALRYPKFVPERQRYSCGAKGCSYISVDEEMFKCHWDALHARSNDFHCVHCPPLQLLDTKISLTASRVIAHLKMHDKNLFACSVCPYYHHKLPILEKHLREFHKAGKVLVVREETASVSNVQPPAAPTMDLKPWQCGLCSFKSLLQPEVVEHCAKIHNSKMQYKCAYCAFRTSNLEYIPKHQAKSHSDKPQETFYYYYREGSIPDDPNGVPIWEKQRLKSETSAPQIKSEHDTSALTTVTVTKAIPPTLDLNIVKKEAVDSSEETIENLCLEFGQFCEPNGLKFKCPLCKIVFEDVLIDMQSHLYEELQYRKWSCNICSYKAFHITGFNEHMKSEHRQNREPIELQSNSRIETWVGKLLEYQKTVINKNKDNLAKQKQEILRSNPSTSMSRNQKLSELNTAGAAPSNINPSIKNTLELERLFGSYGGPVNGTYCCPKCNETFVEENEMQTHLELELNKIRWLCSSCNECFQTYHEAQFHCKSIHSTQPATRPVEATRDTSIRFGWIEGVIGKQKLAIDSVKTIDKKSTPHAIPRSVGVDNSLLVVRYEERVPTPEQVMASSSKLEPKKDIEKAKENEECKLKLSQYCPYCKYANVNERIMNEHILRHYGLKPFICTYCGLNGYKKYLEKHQKSTHPQRPIKFTIATIPKETPTEYMKQRNTSKDVIDEIICLICRKTFSETESKSHLHDGLKPYFGKNGEVVVKCYNCSMLHKDVNTYLNHHKACHPGEGVNYVFFKLNLEENKNKIVCIDCNLAVTNLNGHICTAHSSHDLDNLMSNRPTSLKRKLNSESVPIKQIAKKSTTKLPGAFAKKSTTKLPMETHSKEFSFYGKRPATDILPDSILMPLGNATIPITLKKLPEIFGHPIVSVKKLKIE